MCTNKMHERISLEEVHQVIKSILALFVNGATIKEIQTEYIDYVGESLDIFARGRTKEISRFLCSIPGVTCSRENKALIFRIYNEKTKHISELIQNQKPTKNANSSAGLKKSNIYNSTKSCFFKDNYLFKKKFSYMYGSSDSNLRYGSSKSISTFGSNNCLDNGSQESLHSNAVYYRNTIRNLSRLNEPGSFYQYSLLGDDFFLSLAMTDLKCDSSVIFDKKSGMNIKKSGLCISGQTIKELTNNVRNAERLNEHVIVNIGSVDILHGREFIEIENDFIELYSLLEQKGATPIITTLAPLANLAHMDKIQNIWRKFNLFLVNTCPYLIDIASCFLSNNGHILFDCFRPEANYVSGSCQPHVLWNRIGRQLVLKSIKACI